MKKYVLSLILLATLISAMPGPANAQDTGVPTESIYSKSYQLLSSGLPDIGSSYQTGRGSFSQFLNTAFKIGITVAILLSVIMIVIGGVEYMGGGSVFSTESAKKKFYGAVVGLILALGIYLFLNTINPDMVKLNLNIGFKPANNVSTTNTGSSSTENCPVQSLSKLTDPLAINMENGQGVVWDNTNTRLQCAANRLISLSRATAIVTSAYRPPEYQAHLYEIRDRWCSQNLKSNTTSVCGPTRNEVRDEVLKHFGSAWDCGSVAASNSTHTSGVGVDIINANAEFAPQACLIWKNYPGDPWHFDLDPSCTLTCNK